MKLKSFITLPSPPVRSTDLPKFAFKPITEEFVHGQLKQLRTNKAIGLDNISARLLKDSASVTSKSLTKLFNQSLVTCTFPSLWKFGKVSALFKKGDRCDPNNYRPITVLPTLSKILEKAVHNQLYPFLNDNKIITSKQFGFRPKLSTNTALTHFTDNVLLNMDSGRLQELFSWISRKRSIQLTTIFYSISSDQWVSQKSLLIGSSHILRTENKGRLSEIHSLLLYQLLSGSHREVY